MKRNWDVVSVLAGSALFGTSGVAQALGPQGVPATAVGAARVVLGGLFLILPALRDRRRFETARAMPGTTALLGASVAVYQSCYFSGIGRVGVAIGSIVTVATVPVATGLLAYALRGEKPTGRWYVATALAVTGLAGASGLVGEVRTDPLGFLLCVTAGSSVAVYTVLSRRLLDAGAPITEVSVVAVALSGLLLAPVFVFDGMAWLGTLPGILMAVYLGLFTSAVAFWLNARGLREIPPTAVATLNLAEPLTAVVLAFLVLHERPSATQTMGAVLLGAGLLILALQPRQGIAAQPSGGGAGEEVASASSGS